MSATLILLLSVIAGYVVGSISFAVLIARANGVNILEVGSGNPGATNVLRNISKRAGYLCFLLDALKGTAGVLIGIGIAHIADSPQVDLAGIAGLLGAILGHSFSVFLKFRGGKGVATTIGGLVVLVPLVIVIAVLLWLALFYSTRYVSLASIVLGASLPVSAWLLRVSEPKLWLCVALAVLIIVRHHSNISRLLKGTEPKTGGRK